MLPSDDDADLRYWIYRHDGRAPRGWHVLSRTNDEATARWLYAKARGYLQTGDGVRLVDTETTTVLDECAAR